MITHVSLGNGFAASRRLKQLITDGSIQVAGNRKLRIYGKLDCYSGKRLKKENRVFFQSEQEAVDHGYRCCRNCWCKRKKPTGSNY